ncbi:MAG: rRNA processing protein [Enterococcus viikkiensis]|uniref:rRNA processing protein n=1 Tax=Enterococcus viikkiensis TaxID=930854 RepID=A0ABU3FSE3_9ENTE|nr:rRNA processing protein [Enterococcus viikkiensis]MDT2828563.1 rRNA processing protein [Enterococcus viikkiensis]
MTNYDNEKNCRLRGSMAPKTDDDVALAGTNSNETEHKSEAMAGSNSSEPKEVARAGSNAVDEELPHKSLKEEVKELIEDVEEKFDSKK